MWQVHKVRCCSRFYYPKVHTVQLKVSKVLCTCECDTDKQILLILHFILLMILLYFYVYLSISMCVLAHSLCSGPPDPDQSEPLSLQTGNPPVCRLNACSASWWSSHHHHHITTACSPAVRPAGGALSAGRGLVSAASSGESGPGASCCVTASSGPEKWILGRQVCEEERERELWWY